jgi:hypothetical protein
VVEDIGEIEYGKLTKKVVFTETDHRHAQLIIRLKHDDIKQSDFLRAMITGYLKQDERILSFKKRTKSKKLIQKGKETMEDAGFSEDQLEDLFDLIAEEHPDL